MFDGSCSVNAFGIPLGLYSDRHTIFRSPNEKLTVEQELAGDTKPLSNFGKAMAELHIEHIKAVTPQAKGRVERLWVTLQDRLTIELRLLGVTTLEDANKALPALIKKHNTQFAVKPRKSQSAYLPLDKAVNLDHVFATRHIRQLGHGITLSFANKLFTLAKPSRIPFHAKMAVEVRQTLSGQVILWHHGEALELRVTEKQKPEPKKKKAGSASPRKPAANHPWRNGWSQNQVQRSTKSSTNQVT